MKISDKLDDAFDEDHFNDLLTVKTPATKKQKTEHKSRNSKINASLPLDDESDSEYTVNDDSDDDSEISIDDEEKEDTLKFLVGESSVGNIDDNSLLSAQLMSLWKKRAKVLSSDFAVAGWLLSVDAKIYKDAQSFKHHHECALKRVVEKLFSHVSPDKEKKINACMKQFNDFRNKLFPFDADEMWESEYVYKGESHLWHEKYTHPHCKELAFIGCRVTSKVLGIGSCERSWGETKINKSGKRVNIGSRALEKQSILYGKHSIDNSKSKDVGDPEHHWGPEDMEDNFFNSELEKFMQGISMAHDRAPIREKNISKETSDLFDSTYCVVKRFYAYVEDWEKPLLHCNSVSNKYKLLKKYGGMKYIWPESNETVQKYAATISDQQMIYDKASGWCVILVPKGQIFDWDNWQSYECEPIDTTSDLHDCIAISDQDINVEVYNDDDEKTSAKSHYEQYFPSRPYPGKWCTFPNSLVLNPRE